MALSYNEVGPKSPGDTLVVPFDYTTRDHVYVLVDGADVPKSYYEWASSNTILCLDGFPEGEVTRVERRTPMDQIPSEQQGTGVFDYKGANENDRYLLFIQQEQADQEEDTRDYVDDALAKFVTSDEFNGWTRSGPLVILASGQSNMANRPAYSWQPPSNLLMWDFWGHIDPSTKTGLGWSAPDNGRISTSVAFAAKVARENPNRAVYLIDISKGGMALAEWGPNPSSYNFREAFDNNIQQALDVEGLETVDVFLWRQGESDASLQTSDWVSLFQSWVYEWLCTKPYFPPQTPIFMWGMPPYAEAPNGSGNRHFHRYSSVIRAAVAADPKNRHFVDDSALPIDLWYPDDSIAFIHMTAEGYIASGEVAASDYLNGLFEPITRGIVWNPDTGNMAFGFGASGNPHQNFGPLFGADFLFRRDTTDGLQFAIQNGAAPGEGVSTTLLLQGGAGAWSLNTNDGITSNFGSLLWTGDSRATIVATYSGGYLGLAGGGFTEQIRLYADGAIFRTYPTAPDSLTTDYMAIYKPDTETLGVRVHNGANIRETKLRLQSGWGNYIPALVASTNAEAVVPGTVTWTRSGDYIDIAGTIQIDPVAGGITTADISLPFTISDPEPLMVVGVVCADATQNAGGMMHRVIGSPVMRISVNTDVVTNAKYSFWGRLLVRPVDGP